MRYTRQCLPRSLQYRLVSRHRPSSRSGSDWHCNCFLAGSWSNLARFSCWVCG